MYQCANLFLSELGRNYKPICFSHVADSFGEHHPLFAYVSAQYVVCWTNVINKTWKVYGYKFI